MTDWLLQNHRRALGPLIIAGIMAVRIIVEPLFGQPFDAPGAWIFGVLVVVSASWYIWGRFHRPGGRSSEPADEIADRDGPEA